MQTISTQGIKLIETFEGLRLKPYKDSAGIDTIGIGHVIKPNEQHLYAGITEQQAHELFQKDVGYWINQVNDKHNVVLNQNQFDALVSFYFNTGGSQTLTALINDRASEPTIRNWWENHYITAGGKPVSGLKIRRKAEADFFFGNSLQSVLAKTFIRTHYVNILLIALVISISTYFLVKHTIK